ncbi:MAG: hypothetical protein V7L29_24265 [Nostoc sp.]
MVINIQRVILKAHLLIVYIWLNLSLGDVRDVFKPYLAIFLTPDRHWNSVQIGIALLTTSTARQKSKVKSKKNCILDFCAILNGLFISTVLY